MAYTTRITWEPLRTLDSATLAGAFLPLGGKLLHPSYILKMVNNSTITVLVSIDGVTAIDVCPAGSFWLYDEDEGNREHPAVPQGTQVFVSGAAGVGSFYLVSQYLIVD